MAWEYDRVSRRYRDTASGKYLSPARMTVLRDRFLASQGEKSAAAAGRLAEGKRTVTEWQGEVRRLVKQTFIDQYVLGRGGRSQMTPRDWGTLGQALREQYQFLNQFAGEVAAGGLTQAQINARSQLYLNASRSAFERGHAASYGVRLAHYPGDGRTACRVNCKCRLEYEASETRGMVNVYWRLGAAEHCDDCVMLAAQWNPLRVAGGA